ncbi:MAG TPA: acyltransferase [Mycobacteriales bacterium]|nr:acyltransferase [Mycobacteriales bacterium]
MAVARPQSVTASELAAATPASRDRFVDFVRVASIALVVVGHLTIAAVVRLHGSLHGTNALSATAWLRPATWLFQVMPVFFFVGGFANATALRRRNVRTADFLCRRVERLTTPALVFVAAWLVAAGLAVASGADPVAVREAAKIAAQPLWFIAVYLLVIAVSPVQLRLHQRSRGAVLVSLLGVVACVDAIRLTGLGAGAADVNYLFVFLVAQEMGFLYADGVLATVRPKVLVSVGALAAALLVVLTTAGPYPVSMVGVPGQKVSNMSPPTVCIVLLTVAQTAALLMARPHVERWLRRPVVWKATIAGNGVVLSLFLWHLTALVVVASAFAGAGAPLPTAGSAQWWAFKPLWLVGTGAVLAGIVAIVAPIERRSLVRQSLGNRRTGTALAMVLLTAGGMAVIAATGFTDLLDTGGRHVLGLSVSPAIGLALLCAGAALRFRR